MTGTQFAANLNLWSTFFFLYCSRIATMASNSCDEEGLVTNQIQTTRDANSKRRNAMRREARLGSS